MLLTQQPTPYGITPVGRRLLGQRCSVSFPLGTEMFHFPRFPPHILCIQIWVIEFYSTGFPHSDISGSKVVCHLPEAFRRLPRPSSAPRCQAIHRTPLRAMAIRSPIFRSETEAAQMQLFSYCNCVLYALHVELVDMFYAFFCCRRTIPAVCRFRDGRGQGLARGTVSAHLTVFTKRAWPPAKLTSPLEVSGLAVGRDQARSETFAHETFPVLPVSHLNFVGEMVKLVPIHYRRV